MSGEDKPTPVLISVHFGTFHFISLVEPGPGPSADPALLDLVLLIHDSIFDDVLDERENDFRLEKRKKKKRKRKRKKNGVDWAEERNCPKRNSQRKTEIGPNGTRPKAGQVWPKSGGVRFLKVNLRHPRLTARQKKCKHSKPTCPLPGVRVARVACATTTPPPDQTQI